MDLAGGRDPGNKGRLAIAALARSFAASLAIGAFGTPLGARELPVDLELVLAVDISASISRDEQQLQRQGYVHAFRSPHVVKTILAGLRGRIAVSYVEWANPSVQRVVVPWRLIDGADTADQFAAEMSTAPLRREFDTSIANALVFSSKLFESNSFEGERRVIDISANGPNNTGPPVLPARSSVIGLGITINGLPIMTKMTWGAGLYSIEGLDRYFEDCVIGGDGAFMVAVKRKSDLQDAIRRKLLLEIAWRDGVIVPATYVKGTERMDCLVGEKNNGRLLPLK